MREKNVPAAEGVEEKPGAGLLLKTDVGEVRLGQASLCGITQKPTEHNGPELWLSRPYHAPVRFMFADAIRSDAARVMQGLHARGLAVEMASGDHVKAVSSVAQKVGIDVWRAACSPAQKMAYLEDLKAQGRCVLMVGDGLNDAPALAAADVSMSPTSAADISQTAADIVFQGEGVSYFGCV